ncbi:MAG TPA: hypothetical protein PLL69_05795, partial [Gemmatimonadales bacterium]|nr:hypothetical protein [Gemmatimonadales bacterium]
MTGALRALLVGSISCPLALAAQQATLTTGGGVAKVDQLTSGPIATLAADAMLGFKHLGLVLAGVTTNHQNLGNDTRANADLRWSGTTRGWHVSVGPALELGTDVRNPWTMAWSGNASVRRDLGPVWLGISAGEGITRPDDQRISFGRRGLMAGLDLGPLQLRGDWDHVIVRDSVLRDGVLFGELRNSNDPTLYRSRSRGVNDASVSLELSLPSIELEGTLGRRSGDDIRGLIWWQVGAALPVADAVTMVFSTSRRPADPVLTLR